jgi:SAM-dependent methyltransferase
VPYSRAQQHDLTVRDQFRAVRDADLRRTPERAALCRWEVRQLPRVWRGPEDLTGWIGHIETETVEVAHTRWALPTGPAQQALVSASCRFNEAVLSRLFGSQRVEHERLDFYNMTDWMLQHAYPRPEGDRLERVLDFGAGFGRQAALWLSVREGTTYVATDAVELPYVCQNQYLGSSPYPFVEYLADPARFEIGEVRQSTAFHLPAWRFDLLPAGFFDMVLCVQVLPELREDVLFHSLATFHRVLREGGYLYIRDHGDAWRPAHKQSLPELLPGLGFELEFAPRWRDRHDVHGLPQIWRRRAAGSAPRRSLVKRAVRLTESAARRLWYQGRARQAARRRR